jgi:signal peptidase I, bacterial type
MTPKRKSKILNILFYGLLLIILAIVLYFLRWIFVFDQFHINSNSMSPSIMPGDKIVVNKMILGARIYKSFDFEEGNPLSSFRVKGLRAIKHNDIVVFNFPYNENFDSICFKINYVYVKRCLGLPGDSISVVNGFYQNSHFKDSLGNYRNQFILSQYIDDEALLEAPQTYPRNQTGFDWTIKNFGPLYIPKAGDEIILNKTNYALYKALIEYEIGQNLKIPEDDVLIGEKPVKRYVFLENYYFMAGDNILHSIDSRCFGLVPEPFIVGVVSRIKTPK